LAACVQDIVLEDVDPLLKLSPHALPLAACRGAFSCVVVVGKLWKPPSASFNVV
jgi:hypothetical protein